jgi:hypothetical protein
MQRDWLRVPYLGTDSLWFDRWGQHDYQSPGPELYLREADVWQSRKRVPYSYSSFPFRSMKNRNQKIAIVTRAFYSESGDLQEASTAK